MGILARLGDLVAFTWLKVYLKVAYLVFECLGKVYILYSGRNGREGWIAVTWLEWRIMTCL